MTEVLIEKKNLNGNKSSDAQSLIKPKKKDEGKCC